MPYASASSHSTDKKKKSGEEKARKAEKEHKYLAYVKTLNKSVIAWIQKHVEDKPACILTPVFDDYEKVGSRIDPMRSVFTD
jgi:hypothetical protein